MKKIWFSIVTLLFCSSMVFADFTAEQWQVDLDLFQKYSSASPKDYLGAINLLRKWRECPDDRLKIAGGEGITREAIGAATNNLYREVAQVLTQSYGSMMGSDPIRAAELALNTQQFFTSNPDLMKEFASANGSNPENMKATIDQAARSAFMKAYEAAAQEYSRLHKEGKDEEAKKISSGWTRVISDWNAHNSPLPKAFETFTGVDPQGTVDRVKDLEKDGEAWKKAVESGDSKTAFALVEKWVKLEKEHPEQAAQINFIFNAAKGTTASDKTDWENIFNVETYAKFWDYDVNAYQKLIASGKTKEALELIGKWIEIFNGRFGAGLAKRLGSDLSKVMEALKAEERKISNLDPAIATENVRSFKKDLDEFNQISKVFHDANVTPGSVEWYNSAARAAELCDKWSKIAKDNPSLAAEVKKATGIDLPKAARDTIGYLLDKTIVDSSKVFNSYLGTGKFKEALELVKGWKNYLEKHPEVQSVAVEKYGKDFLATLQRYEKGLTAMTEDPATAAQPTAPTATEEIAQEPQGTDQTTPGTLGTSGN